MKKKMAVASGLLLTAILLTGCGGNKRTSLWENGMPQK